MATSILEYGKASFDQYGLRSVRVVVLEILISCRPSHLNLRRWLCGLCFYGCLESVKLHAAYAACRIYARCMHGLHQGLCPPFWSFLCLPHEMKKGSELCRKWLLYLQMAREISSAVDDSFYAAQYCPGTSTLFAFGSKTTQLMMMPHRIVEIQPPAMQVNDYEDRNLPIYHNFLTSYIQNVGVRNGPRKTFSSASDPSRVLQVPTIK